MLEIENIMFIQPCFIRKNTSELRNMLEKFGYKYSTFDSLKLDGIITFPNGKYSVWANYNFNVKDTLKSYIDCGTNEELFLALASLRDDTSINQYYWFNDRLFKCEGLEFDRVLKNNTANYLLRCRCVDKPMILSCFKERNIKKATVEELIKYFNK